VNISEEILTDSWLFEQDQTWQPEIVGAKVMQGAPACIARNIGLPEVHASDKKPFVFATRFPNGAVAVAAQERTNVGRGWYMPSCNVSLPVSDAAGPFGVFGQFNSLTLTFDAPIQKKRVLAQDLADDASTDITHEVQMRGKSLYIPGEVIRRVGLQKATPGDISAPGMVVALR
jgi:hypothetical protein